MQKQSNKLYKCYKCIFEKNCIKVTTKQINFVAFYCQITSWQQSQLIIPNKHIGEKTSTHSFNISLLEGIIC